MRKGSHHSPETKEKLRRVLLGRSSSPESCEKMKKAHQGHPSGMLGKHHSQDTIDRLRAALKGRPRPPRPPPSKEFCEKMRERTSGEKNPNFGKHHSPDTLSKISRTRKKQWQDPAYVQKQMKARGCRPNRPELQLQTILDDLDPGNWIYVGDGRDKQYILSGKVPDFVHTTKNLIIELFGDYWHKQEEIEPRTKVFEKHGYQTLIVWEHELQEQQRLIERIKGHAGREGARSRAEVF